MNDQSLQKWNSVILDWINCLDISNHTQNISCLKNGDFFNKILVLLQPDLPTSLKEFLQTHYPRFEIPSDESDFTDCELTAAASLLLHYMCLYDRRDSLISPLCDKLTSNVQTHIKYFLEHFTSSTSFEEFDEVVRKAIDCELADDLLTQKNVMEWNSSGESPFVCNSPLVEYFKTPVSRTAKMQEKDREIRRLQQELEMERFDKEDLNVELKEHKERIQKIAQEVQDKSVTISSLSSRLAELEESVPPSKSREINDIEKLLRSELADSQNYISQLQSEHGEIVMRSEEIAKKLAFTEEILCTWQEKAIQFESKYDAIAERHKAQEEELTNIRINYSELSALLDEFRQNKTNTSTYELDTSTSVKSTQEDKTFEEDLAATVVEIQLKECQLEMEQLQANLTNKIEHSDVIEKQLQETLKELELCHDNCKGLENVKNEVEINLDSYILTNQKLDSKINELTDEYTTVEKANKDLHESLQASIERSQILEDELHETKIHFDELNNNHKRILYSNEQLLEQITKLSQTEESLLLLNETIVKQIEDVSNENCMKDSQLAMLREKLQLGEAAIDKNNELINSLMKDLVSVDAIRNDLDEKLKDRNSNFTALEEESRLLQQQYEEVVENFNESNFNLAALKKQIKETDNKLQVNIDRLEEIIMGSIESSGTEKIERFVQLLEKLSTKQFSFENTIENNKKLNEELEQQVAYLQLSDLTNKENLESLQKTLQDSQNTVKQFEIEIKIKGNEIEVLLEHIKSLNETVEGLEELKERLNQNNIELEMSKSDNLRLTKELQQIICESAHRLELNEQLITKLDKLQDQHKDMLTEIEKNEVQIIGHQKDNNELVSKLAKIEQDSNQKTKDNEDLVKTIVVLESKISDMLKEVEMLNRDIVEQKYNGQELLKKLEYFEQQNSLQSDVIDGLQNSLADLEATKNSLNAEIIDYQVVSMEQKRQCENLMQKVENVEQEIVQKALENSELIGKVVIMELSNTNLEKEIEKLQVALKEQTQQSEELYAKFENVEKLGSVRLNQNEQLSTTLTALQVEYELEKSHADDLLSKLAIAEKESIHWMEDREKLNLTVQNFQTTQSELEKNIVSIRNDFATSKLENDILNVTVNNLQTTKVALENDIGCISLELADSKQECNNNKITIQDLMNEIDVQLAKLKDKDSELAYTKEQFSNKELQRMHTINELNRKIEELEVSKEHFFTDLQVAKDSCLLKQQEIDDLSKSKNQLDKHLNKALMQHEKKSDLMNLTIENLMTKVNETNEEKNKIEQSLSEETQKVVSLTEERIKIIDERNMLQDELGNTKMALEKKEKECLNKDEIVDKANQELLVLRLEFEVKQSEIADARNLIKLLDAEKGVAMDNSDTLSNKLIKLEEKHKATCEELKAINDIRDSLTQKMEHFKESMQTVFQHFGIRRKNMKQSLDDLKKYKLQKDDEIRVLNETLAELREQLEKTKEEGHSVKKELETRIADKEKRLETLEIDIENLKITESGCLQEISMLKEELNYTIDKYTEALQAEKDLKRENEARIHNLTESVHEMLEKYNVLDKEHKQLLDEFAYNNKSCAELQSAKECLELEIVKLKSEYEEDMKSCRIDFESELSTLKKIETNLNREITQLKDSLTMANEDEVSLRNELQDAKSHLHIIQTEKAGLFNKLDILELTYDDLQRAYKSMEITNEQYLKETKAALIKVQDQLQAEIKVKERMTTQKDKEINKLTREVQKLTDRLMKEEEIFKLDTEMRQKEIGVLQKDVCTFTMNIETLTNEKDVLQLRIDQQKQQYDDLLDKSKEKDQLIADFEKQLRNLQISHDVLETGKVKMECLQQELLARLSELEKKHRVETEEHKTTKNNILAQIEKAKAQIRENEELIQAKSTEIDAANEEFDSVQLILTNMTKKMETTSRQLSVIHEDYEGKLKSEREAFEELRSQYTTATSEMKYMSNMNEELHKELEELKVERSNAEILIGEKEILIGELQQKYDYVASLVVDKDATIASLQAELEDKLEQLANAAGERCHVEDIRRRTQQELHSVMRQKEELIEKHAQFERVGEENLLRVHCKTKELLARLNDAENRTVNECTQRGEIENLLMVERDAKRFMEMRVEKLEAQLYDANVLKKKLTNNIRRFSSLLQENEDSLDEEELDDLIVNTERRIIHVFSKLREMNSINDIAQKDKEYAEKTLEELGKCNMELKNEKAKLLETYEKLHEEKLALAQEKAKESKSLENLKMQYEVLKNKEHSSTLLTQKLDDLQQKNQQRYQNYMEFLQQTQGVFKEIEIMISERNQVEQIVCNLKDNYTTVQIRATHITEETHKLHNEQKNALEIIIDDIYKQFRRYSKLIYNLNLKCHQIVERTVSAIIYDKIIDWVSLYKELSNQELLEKIEDLKDNASNALEQLQTFIITIEALDVKAEKPKVLKENLQPLRKPNEDEWKKKYWNVKQKLTLVENAKCNFEKKIRQLREENKKLTTSNCSTSTTIKVEVDPDINQTNTLKYMTQDEYIELKQQYEFQLLEWEDKYKQLQGESIPDSKASMASVMELVEVKHELETIKTSYMDLKVNFSKLELDQSALQKLVDNRNEQLLAMASTSESYSQLFEENSKLQSEIDTIKYKRNRDREEFVKQLKQNDMDVNKKMQAIKSEYDLKLEKIKLKIVSKYKEQVEQCETQNIEKIMTMKEDNERYKSTICKLQCELAQAQAKVEILDSENHYTLQNLRVQKDEFGFKEPLALTRRASSQCLLSETMRNAILGERRFSTLPRNAQPMDVIEEVRYRRRTSATPAPPPTELEMEDEGDMFNNKYLRDLKEGRCNIISGNERDSTSSRLSEFAYRNSLCPPHLKSSYPAETQFLDHRQFKDDDLKTGNIELDDSMKTYLLPQEKSKKKDIGTTSYKRPGPPTPSKHGGRLSLQGNERVLRELTDQKRATPNPLRSLFSRSKDTTAESTVSPKKRTSFFRR